MKTLTLIHTETFLSTDADTFKYYLAISKDTIVVLEKAEDSWDVVDHIIVGTNINTDIYEFNTMDDMLDIIFIVTNTIRKYGNIVLESKFNIIS